VVRFEKWQALGNDYLIVEAAALPWELSEERVQRVCRPHYGVGADGVLLLSPVEEPEHVAKLRIFNPDGTEAEMSGNGAREAALYLRRAGWTDEESFSILTAAGPIRPTIRDERTCALEMGRAATASDDFPSGPADGRGELEAAGRSWRFQYVSIGNPQCAIDAGTGVEDLDLATIGPEVERHELFPNRANVSFFRVDDAQRGSPSVLRARIFERGAGETLSSGTGACGAAVAAALAGVDSPLTVVLDGGELEVEVSDELDVRLTGPAEPVYAGELSAEFVRALR
jgi:diaminopimelate epimerase